jgi:F-type H+-transporting ATPase subunit alpha
LDRGARLVELLKQPNYSPYPMDEEVVSVWAGTEGKLDDIPVGEIRRFETEFLAYLRHSHAGVLATIASDEWNDDLVVSLDDAIAQFKQMFLAADGKPVVQEDPAKAMAEGVETKEAVKRVKKAPPKPPAKK